MNYSIETIEKVQQGRMLPVMEHFYTIQGEGFYTGVVVILFVCPIVM